MPGSTFEAVLRGLGFAAPAGPAMLAPRKPLAKPLLTCDHITPAYMSTCLAERQSRTSETASSVPEQPSEADVLQVPVGLVSVPATKPPCRNAPGANGLFGLAKSMCS